MSATRVFEAKHISCIRGGRVLFQNLSFTLDAGDVAHLSGPNGAGKTSLLRIMAGALPVAAGKMTGPDLFSYLPSDDAALKWQETAFDNLLFWARVCGADEKACDAALEKMGLEKLRDTPVKFLSAGQRRRLSISRVFLRQDARLWLLDEPLNGLDLRSYDFFMAALQAHSAQGGCAAIASHFAIDSPRNGQLTRIDIGYAS